MFRTRTESARPDIRIRTECDVNEDISHESVPSICQRVTSIMCQGTSSQLLGMWHHRLATYYVVSGLHSHEKHTFDAGLLPSPPESSPESSDWDE